MAFFTHAAQIPSLLDIAISIETLDNRGKGGGSLKQREGIVVAKIDLYCKTLSLVTIITLFQCKLAVPSNVRVIPRQVDRHKIELSICCNLSFKFL